MNEQPKTEKDLLRQQVLTHVADLRDRCQNILDTEDLFGVYNGVNGLRSLVGQIDKATSRYITIH